MKLKRNTLPATKKIAEERAVIRSAFRKYVKALILQNLCYFKNCDCHPSGKPRCRRYSEIVNFLNSNGVESIRGKKWHRNTVQRLLESNE